MASLQNTASGFYIAFRFQGRRYKRSLKTKSERQAVGKRSRVEETIHLVESGRLEIPASVDVCDFLMAEGKIVERPTKFREPNLKELCDEYFSCLPERSLEPNTVEMMQIHRRHLQRHFGVRFKVHQLNSTDLQQYVNQRAKAPGRRGGQMTASTIRKEVNTFRAIWKWAVVHEQLAPLDFPAKTLRYPKTEELPPFQTLEEIRQQTRTLDPKSRQFAELWSCAYLNRDEVEALLDHVKANARYGFLYPMFVLAAHTGARRSEILRSEFGDWQSPFFTVREKKRRKGRNSTRQVPASTRLMMAMDDWLSVRPESSFTICHVGGSHCHSQPGDPISTSESNKQFKRALKGSEFEHLRGWHTLRHSFCSNCAAKGVDQRVIDEWVGHTSEEMRRRYRHLFPSTSQAAIRLVFD